MVSNRQRNAEHDDARTAARPATAQAAVSSSRFIIAQVCGLLVGLGIALWYETARLQENIENGIPLGEWCIGINVDTTPFLLLFVLLPGFWIVRRQLLEGATVSAWWRDWFGPQTKPDFPQRPGALRRAWVLSVLVAVTAFALSANVADQFGILPPAYHDEYSYLFQSQTFLAGRLSFPSDTRAPELFDQMHVLNDGGKFASRYFPGTGAWIAPFLHLGNPYLGHWLAGSLAAFFVFWAGRELGGNLTGFVAGMLTALSPGMALFSNLLLAHHPTLVGLTAFLFAFLKMMRTHGRGWALATGCGLAFAMLCRPMTAAGFALPFGIWFVAWWLGWSRDTSAGSWRARTTLVLAMGAPLLAGLALMFVYNRAITGSGWTTPYQLYTDIYTPRHVYGFDNVVRGEQHLGPKVLENYDRWAKNLTPQLAARNVVVRLVTSLKWSLGIIPLAIAFVVLPLAVVPGERRWMLVVAGIVTLHAAHVPYWYDGIMHWHYVFESCILWLLIFGGVTTALFERWSNLERPMMPIWWSLVVAAAMLPTFAALPPFWSPSRMENGVDSIEYSRKKYMALLVKMNHVVRERPALVLVEHDAAEQHIDYVVNSPDLQQEVLMARRRPGGPSIEEIARLFPERTIYVFEARKSMIKRVARRTE